jgi:hypothetical protein
MDKTNCYKCEYRGTVAGSCHSSCNHPSFAEVNNNPMAQIMGIFASVGRVPPIQAQVDGITVKGNSHGIRNGWFNHPFDFNPVWLEECTGFKAKEGDNNA